LNAGITAPSYTDVSDLTVTDGIGFTSYVRVVAMAHCPADGVNVYVPVAWLSTADGLHVPVIKSVEVVGKTGGTEPIQTD